MKKLTRSELIAYLEESQSEVSTQAAIIKRLEKEKEELLNALKVLQSDLMGECKKTR